MKPIPNPIQGIRQAIHIVNVAGQSGKKLLKLALPIIAVIFSTVEEIRKSKIQRLR